MNVRVPFVNSLNFQPLDFNRAPPFINNSEQDCFDIHKQLTLFSSDEAEDKWSIVFVDPFEGKTLNSYRSTSPTTGVEMSGNMNLMKQNQNRGM